MFQHALDTLSGEALSVSRAPFVSKLMLCLRTSSLFRHRGRLTESSIMHSHNIFSCVRPPQRASSRCFTGSVRIKSDGFAQDILHLCCRGLLIESFIMHSHCVLSCFRPPNGVALGVHGSVRIESYSFATNALQFLSSRYAYRNLYHVFTQCFMSFRFSKR